MYELSTRLGASETDIQQILLLSTTERASSINEGRTFTCLKKEIDWLSTSAPCSTSKNSDF